MSVASTPRKVLSSLDIESLAVAIRLRGRDDPAQRFAKKVRRGSPDKQVARLRARSFALDDEFRSFLTMPGLFFAFEWMLLEKRERNRVMRDNRRRPERTYIACIEREPEIYRAGIRFMPRNDLGHLKILTSIPYASHSLMSSHIARYHQISFEDYAGQGVRHDFAFLDFNGPVTATRCAAIDRFWRLSKPTVLVVNYMNHRFHNGWNGTRAYDEVCEACGSSVPVDDFRYGQFRQLAFDRRRAELPASGEAGKQP